MNAKIITDLTGTVADGKWHEPVGIRSTVADEPRPGVIRKFTLGHAGLMGSYAGKHVAIPLSELIALFEKSAPEFCAPPEPKFTGEDIPVEILKG